MRFWERRGEERRESSEERDSLGDQLRRLPGGDDCRAVNSALQPANLAFQLRHSRESGNPDVCRYYLISGRDCAPLSSPPPVIPAKAGIQTFADTFYLISGRGCASLSPPPSFPRKRESRCLRIPLTHPQARLRVFVRIRIFRIRGIFRISLRPDCDFRHNRNFPQDEYG